MRTAPVRMLAVAAFVLLGAVACSSSSPSANSTTSTTTTATNAAPQRGDAYVALGSSIASGYGISVQSTSCGRSSRDYPQLVAKHYGLQLTDVTCGAASIRHLLDEPQGDNPPQINAVTAAAKLVTVTVGGNDIGYNATAVGCGDPAGVCTGPSDLDANLVKLDHDLKRLIDRIKAAAPEATIVFTTYPREVPADKNCPELSFTDDEAMIVRNIGEKLEQAFVDVVKPMKDVVFVDPYVAPGDHTGCAPASERWTAGHIADDGFAYHPTALGHQVMADMIVKALAG